MSEVLTSLEAERMVLGAVVVDNKAMDTVAATLVSKHFADSKHRLVWEAMTALYERGQPIDYVTLRDELGDTLERIGGMAWLGQLDDGMPRVTNPDHWAKIVLERARRRAFVSITQRSVEDAGNDAITTDELLEKHAEQLSRIMNSRHATVRPIKAVLPEAVESLNEFARSETGLVGIPSGLYDIDRLLGGWRKGALYVMAARPTRGKSTLCAQFAVHAAAKAKSVLVFAMEMPDVDVAERMLCSEAGVNKWEDLRQKRGSAQSTLPEAWARIGAAVGRLSKMPIWFDGRETPTLAQIRAATRQHQATKGCDLVIVDYLQRCALPTGVDQWLGVGQVAQGLKSLARALNVPVIAACQLTADAEERRPTMANLAQSRQIISAEADVIAFLHPEHPGEWRAQPYPQINFIVDKHRQGACDSIPLSFEKATNRFLSMSNAPTTETPYAS